MTKKELEEIADRYWERMLTEFNDANGEESLAEYYSGKEAVIRDIVKMFEPLMG